MSKLASRCSAILIASGLSGLLAGCPQTSSPTMNAPPSAVNVRPIPNPGSGITSTPAPGSVITSPTPFPGGSTGVPSGTPGSNDSGVPGSTGLSISSTNLPTAVLNFNYLFGLQVAGGSGSYRWTVVSGNLPNGLTLDQNTGQIFGKPTQTGTFSFDIQVIDNQRATVDRRNLFILVSDSNNGLNSLSILSSNLPSGVVDRRYSRILEITGGVGPFSWNITAGSLPDGLSLNTSTGEISGTPTLSGEETFTVRVTDARGDTETKTLSITINRTDTDITILTPILPAVAVGSSAYTRTVCGLSFSGQLVATGGDGDYDWEISKGEDDLNDAGLEIDRNSGEIEFSGGGLTAGSYTITVRVTDGEDNSASRVYTIDIDDLLIHDFSPTAGSEDTNMVIFGEGLSGLGGNVLFGGVASSGLSYISSSGDCDQISTVVPANARTGLLSIDDGSGTVLGASDMPFVAEDVVISEVFLSPDSSGNQYVELKNTGTSSVSIAGWWLKYTNLAGNIQSFVLPSETPPLAPGKKTVINIGVSGGTSATNIYTGTSVSEILFNTVSGGDVTTIALCAGNCDTNGTVASAAYDTNIRDYLHFGPTGSSTTDPESLYTYASNAGLWGAASDTIDAEDMLDPLSASINTTEGDPDAAHYGVLEGVASLATNYSGLLLDDADKFDNYTGDAVFYFTPIGGAAAGNEQRIRRTVTGTGNGASNDRVRINSALFTSAISASNTGDGSNNNGILVNDVSLLSPGDYLNVIAGGTIRIIDELTAGPRIELTQILSTESVVSNVSDGTTGAGIELSNGDLLGTEAALEGTNISIAYDRTPLNLTDAPAFTVVRRVVDLALGASDYLLLDQPLASMTVDSSNVGDGLTGNEILTTGVGNFKTGDKALYNGQPCSDGLPCDLIIGGSQVRLSMPLATMAIDATNTGNGDEFTRITVDDVSGFSLEDTILVNGAERSISAITPAFGSSLPRIELDSPLSMTPSTNVGDGTSGNGIKVSLTEGFAVGNRVSVRGQQANITAIKAGPLVELSAVIYSVNVLSGNTGDGTALAPLQVGDATGFLQVGNTVRIPSINQTRTISALTTSTMTLNSAAVSATQTSLSAPALISATSVTVVSSSGFAVNDWIKFSNGNIRKIATVPDATTITFSTGLSSALASGATVNALLDNEALNFVPTSSALLPVGGGTVAYALNLVPVDGVFTLVPTDDPLVRVSRIPVAGSIYLAPKTGILRKYQSIEFNNGGSQDDTDYTTTATPTKGQ